MRLEWFVETFRWEAWRVPEVVIGVVMAWVAAVVVIRYERRRHAEAIKQAARFAWKYAAGLPLTDDERRWAELAKRPVPQSVFEHVARVCPGRRY